MTLTTGDIEKARSIPVTQLLGIPDLQRKRMIKCPFHSDRTASMCLYPNGGYHCFGCGAHGNNALDFSIKLGYTFKEAVLELNKL